jgi:sensor histidine kinase regulating citrate/malate metabolism
MFKTLAGRALVPVGLAVTGFVVVCCLLLYSAIRSGVNEYAVSEATNLADTVLKSTHYAMLKSDRETLATIIRNVGEQKGVEHVRIFNKKGIVNISAKTGEINRQLDKKSEGCISCHNGPIPITTLGTMQQARRFKNSAHKEVLAITAPIYNEPECFNAACHIHLPGQKILGTLDIGLSQDSLIKSLATIRLQMIIFTVMTLLLTISGVTALLRRSVFIPMQRLRKFVEESGTSRQTAPPHLPQDLDRIAHCYHDLQVKLENIQQDRDISGNSLTKE